MHILHIQIQKKWNDPLVKRTLLILWSDEKIMKISILRGHDKGAYINFDIRCRSGIVLWNRIGKKLNKLPNFKNCSIVLTVVKDDWNNYQLIQSCYE